MEQGSANSRRAQEIAKASSKRGLVLGIVTLVALVVVVLAFRDRIHFDWNAFWRQLRHVHRGHALAGMLLIYATYWLRAVRWSVLVRPMKKVSMGALVGPQFIGFTAVALFGRLADLTRPYLVARKIGLPLSTQVAVYTIERMFDLGAAALIFSTALAFAPRDLPHHDVFVRTGLGSLAVTAAIAIFAGAVRVAGGAVAGFARTVLKPISKPIAESIAEKIVGFREGLNAIKSWQEVGVVAGISLLMWGMIGYAYLGDGACVRRHSGADRADFFADDAADGDEYWRRSVAAADRGVVHADCCDGDGDAYILWGTDRGCDGMRRCCWQ